MKNINHKIFSAVAIITFGGVWAACSDPDMLEPTPSTGSSNFTASFLLVNASPDAPSLDLLINNSKTGLSVDGSEAQNAYAKVPITSNGVFANTNIRAKATTGSIGGVLGSNDAIFRAGNANSNNFQISDSATYTIIVMDSITRPKPLRTLNSKSFGDTTYFNPANGKMISVVEKAGMTSAQRSKLVPIGTVPLGATDPGGLRFLVVLDQLPLPSTTRLPKPATGKASIRFIHATADAGTATVTYDATNVTSGTLVNPLKVSSSFNPTVGSRSVASGTTALTYPFQTVDSGVHTVVAKVGGNEVAKLENYTFDDKGVYTIIMSGRLQDGSLDLVVVKNK